MIRISDDSSTESDGGLDSDFHSSPSPCWMMTWSSWMPSGSQLMTAAPCAPTAGPARPGILERVERLKQDLLAKVRALGRELPVNTLDELIDQLGGPEQVAEMTGRKGRVVSGLMGLWLLSPGQSRASPSTT